MLMKKKVMTENSAEIMMVMAMKVLTEVVSLLAVEEMEEVRVEEKLR